MVLDHYYGMITTGGYLDDNWGIFHQRHLMSIHYQEQPGNGLVGKDTCLLLLTPTSAHGIYDRLSGGWSFLNM